MIRFYSVITTQPSSQSNRVVLHHPPPEAQASSPAFYSRELRRRPAHFPPLLSLCRCWPGRWRCAPESLFSTESSVVGGMSSPGSAVSKGGPGKSISISMSKGSPGAAVAVSEGGPGLRRSGWSRHSRLRCLRAVPAQVHLGKRKTPFFFLDLSGGQNSSATSAGHLRSLSMATKMGVYSPS